MDIRIDHEFATLFDWCLNKEDFAQLESNCVKDGRIIDPLVLWEGRDILVDGHSRYKIARKHHLPFDVVRRPFPDRTAVLLWMRTHALGHRNLTSEQQRILRAELVTAMAPTTASVKEAEQRVAASTGVDARTVQRDRQYAAAMKDVTPSVRNKILAHEVRLPRVEVETLATLEEADQEIAVELLQRGEIDSITEYAPEGEAPEPEKLADPLEEQRFAMQRHNKELLAYAKALTDFIHQMPVSAWLTQERREIALSHLKAAAATVKAAMGYSACAKCTGGGCDKCKQTGFLPKIEAYLQR